MAAPVLRPSTGFCLETKSTSSSSGKWFINMAKHKLCELPIAYSGKPVSREYILSHGIGNMKVPFDIGSFRKVKERAEGAKQTTYCIDVIFNPLIIQLFMDDDFCNSMTQYRQFVIGLVLKRVEESIGVRLSQDVKLVKTIRYKDGEGADGNLPREFTEVAGSADCSDEEVPKPVNVNRVDDAEPLILDITGNTTSRALKKGFLNNNKAAGSLYGEHGSGEGVLPENAGDPMGWMPKKLRNTCKIVDCNNPEYQANEKARKVAEETNKMNKDFKDQISKDMEKWIKTSQPDKWNEDLPTGSEPQSTVEKYNVDYSRFDKLDDVEETTAVEERDWYYDGSGVRRRIEQATRPSGAPSHGGSESAITKGFLSKAKTPLYPEGSKEHSRPTEDELLKGLMAQAQSMTSDAPSSASGAKAEQQSTQNVSVKVQESRTPSFDLSEVPGHLQLVVSVPGIDSMQDVGLDVTERSVSLNFPACSHWRPLQVELPSSVAPASTKAKFSKKKGTITVALPTAGATS